MSRNADVHAPIAKASDTIAAAEVILFFLRCRKPNKITSAAAIVSLALAIGACTSAFRLIDALLLRPLPVVEPEGLYILSRHGAGFNGKPGTFEDYQYPLFRQLRGAVKDQAELLAISYVQRMDLTYGADQEMEKAHLQYVSGSMFRDRKSTRLNSSHSQISYAVFCLK